eukprot:6466028-Amphidinium_carterae.1
MAARLGQSIFEAWELRLRVYVDDPLVAVAGPPCLASYRFGLLLLLWQSFGFDLSWAKGGWGRSLCWIGARFKVLVDVYGYPAVEMSLAEKKYSEMKDAVKSLLHST